jgi:hypothetical protein
LELYRQLNLHQLYFEYWDSLFDDDHVYRSVHRGLLHLDTFVNRKGLFILPSPWAFQKRDVEEDSCHRRELKMDYVSLSVIAAQTSSELLFFVSLVAKQLLPSLESLLL